jgi:hypothetical protein
MAPAIANSVARAKSTNLRKLFPHHASSPPHRDRLPRGVAFDAKLPSTLTGPRIGGHAGRTTREPSLRPLSRWMTLPGGVKLRLAKHICREGKRECSPNGRFGQIDRKGALPLRTGEPDYGLWRRMCYNKMQAGYRRAKSCFPVLRESMRRIAAPFHAKE